MIFRAGNGVKVGIPPGYHMHGMEVSGNEQKKSGIKERKSRTGQMNLP